MGLDGMRLLTTEDQFEVQIMIALAKATSDVEGDKMEVNASHIAHAVGKLFK